MRNSKITWAVVIGAVVAVLAGIGVAIAVNRRSTSSDASPVSSAPASAPSLESTAGPSASPAPSPGADITGPLDLLLVGVDTRISISDWESHSDTIMLLHVESGLKSAYLYSLPRDLRVEIPAFKKSG